MLPLQRRHILLDYLARQGSATVAELSSQLRVSEMTVRRDLRTLEQEGLLQRTHGGAVHVGVPGSEPTFDTKRPQQEETKQLLAALAVNRFVADNAIIILEGGTTVTCMARHLSRFNNLTVLTNGLHTAMALRGLGTRSTVMGCGGMLRDTSATFVGPAAERFFRQFHADVAFFSATGVTLEDGFTDPNQLEREVKREMHAAAARRVMLIDSTKVGVRSLMTTFRFDEIDTLITDGGAPADFVHALRAMGVDVLIAERAAHE